MTWVLLGTGLAATGVGITSGLLANQSKDELKATCAGESNTLCPESSRDIAQTMQRRARIADISYIAGGRSSARGSSHGPSHRGVVKKSP